MGNRVVHHVKTGVIKIERVEAAKTDDVKVDDKHKVAEPKAT